MLKCKHEVAVNYERCFKCNPLTEKEKEKQKKNCPNCGTGIRGVDPLCDNCWEEYLGTHIGGR